MATLINSNRTKLVFVNNAIKVTPLFPIHVCTSAALGQVLTICGIPVVEGGQPCYTATECPITIIDKGKLKYEGPSQATDIETP